MVALTGSSDGERLVRRAARIAQRTKGDLVAVHVVPQDGLSAPSAELLAQQRELLGEVGGTYHEVVGADVGEALLDAARSLNVTQLVMGATRRSRWQRLTRGSVIGKVIRESGVPIDIHVISHPEARSEEAFVVPRTRRPAALPRRRQALGALLAVAGLPLLTALLVPLRGELELPSVMLLFLLLVVVVAAVGGLAPGLAAAVGAFLLVNWFFIQPYNTFTIAEAEDVLALFVFLAVGAIVSSFVALAARRAAEGARARAEAEALVAPRRLVDRLGGARRAPPGARARGGRGSSPARGRLADRGRERRPCSGEPRGGQLHDRARLRPRARAQRGADPREDRRILDAFAKELTASVHLGELEARRGGGGRSLRDERAADGAPGRRLARPAHADLRDQGFGHEPAPAGHRVDARGARRSSCRRSTRRRTVSTHSSATCST